MLSLASFLKKKAIENAAKQTLFQIHSYRHGKMNFSDHKWVNFHRRKREKICVFLTHRLCNLSCDLWSPGICDIYLYTLMARRKTSARLGRKQQLETEHRKKKKSKFTALFGNNSILD